MSRKSALRGREVEDDSSSAQSFQSIPWPMDLPDAIASTGLRSHDSDRCASTGKGTVMAEGKYSSTQRRARMSFESIEVKWEQKLRWQTGDSLLVFRGTGCSVG